MFRVFLGKRLFSSSRANDAEKSDFFDNGGTSPRRNRRAFERFSVDHKHLTILNEQDILLVQDISAKGFSTIVASSSLPRFSTGDLYDARVRYLGEVYHLQIKVSWKSRDTVGFEVFRPDLRTLRFIQRLIRPIEIANSLKEVPDSLLGDIDEGKVWLRGDCGADFYLWYNQGSELVALYFVVDSEFVSWRVGEGFKTGNVRIDGNDTAFSGPDQAVQLEDEQVDTEKKQFLIDVVMAMEPSYRDELLTRVAV